MPPEVLSDAISNNVMIGRPFGGTAVVVSTNPANRCSRMSTISISCHHVELSTSSTMFHTCFTVDCIRKMCLLSGLPHAHPWSCRIGPIHFLARCCIRCMNQALVLLRLVLYMLVMFYTSCFCSLCCNVVEVRFGLLVPAKQFVWKSGF